MAAVLFVGSRRAALRAADRLGIGALLVGAQRPRRLPPERFAAVAPDAGEEEMVAAALGLAAVERPHAVVALTERGVVAASRLRGALGLPSAGGPATAWTDKLAMKRAVRAAGIRCADWVKVDQATAPAHLLARLGLPLVIKPRRASGGRGTHVVQDPGLLRHLMADDGIAESWVHGTEMSVEALVVRGRVCFRSTTRYLVPTWANVVPAALPPPLLGRIDDLLRRSVAALGVRQGMVHLELFLTEDGPAFGEMAVRPPGGHIMELLELAWGFDPWEAVLRVALGERPALPEQPTRSAGAFILHPGPGVVRSVDGVDAARRMPGVVAVRCRARVGDEIDAREGSGNEVGHILVAATGHPDTVSALRGARERVSLVMGAHRRASPEAHSLASSSRTLSVRVSSSSRTSSRNSSAMG